MTELEIKLLNLCKGKSWEFTTDFGALIPEIIETIKAQLVPEGFVLVPENASKEMIKQGYEAYDGFFTLGSVRNVWDAMIEAQEQSHD